MTFYNEPLFWKAVGAAFTFLTTVVVCVRWLLRVMYIYRQKNLLIKARLEKEVQKLKEDNINLAISGLRETIGHIKPVVQLHEIKMGTLQVDLRNVESLVRQFGARADDLKSSYDNFNNTVPKLATSGQMLLERFHKIENEWVEFKNGDILVRNKK